MSQAVIALCVLLYLVWHTAALEERTRLQLSRDSVSRGDGLAMLQERYHYTIKRQSEVNTGNRTVALWNCSRLYDASYGYNASGCRFIHENCQSKAHLINYLSFIKCDLPSRARVRKNPPTNVYLTTVSTMFIHSNLYDNTACRVYSVSTMVCLPYISPCYDGGLCTECLNNKLCNCITCRWTISLCLH